MEPATSFILWWVPSACQNGGTIHVPVPSGSWKLSRPSQQLQLGTWSPSQWSGRQGSCPCPAWSTSHRPAASHWSVRLEEGQQELQCWASGTVHRHCSEILWLPWGPLQKHHEIPGARSGPVWVDGPSSCAVFELFGLLPACCRWAAWSKLQSARALQRPHQQSHTVGEPQAPSKPLPRPRPSTADSFPCTGFEVQDPAHDLQVHNVDDPLDIEVETPYTHSSWWFVCWWSFGPASTVRPCPNIHIQNDTDRTYIENQGACSRKWSSRKEPVQAAPRARGHLEVLGSHRPFSRTSSARRDAILEVPARLLAAPRSWRWGSAWGSRGHRMVPAAPHLELLLEVVGGTTCGARQGQSPIQWSIQRSQLGHPGSQQSWRHGLHSCRPPRSLEASAQHEVLRSHSRGARCGPRRWSGRRFEVDDVEQVVHHRHRSRPWCRHPQWWRQIPVCRNPHSQQVVDPGRHQEPVASQTGEAKASTSPQVQRDPKVQAGILHVGRLWLVARVHCATWSASSRSPSWSPAPQWWGVHKAREFHQPTKRLELGHGCH